VDNAVAEGLGGRRKKAFRFRQDVLPRLPTELRVVVGCAEIIAPEVTSYDFIEIHPDEARVKGIRCDDAGKAIPAIINIIEIDLRALRMRSSSPMERCSTSKVDIFRWAIRGGRHRRKSTAN